MQKKSPKNRAACLRRCRWGLTLIELVIAFSAACIVFSATAIIMVFGQRSLNRGWEQVNLQRDASYAMLKINHSIRCATNATLDADGNGVKIYHSVEWIRFRFVPGQRDLRYQLDGEDEQTLLDGVVDNVVFDVTGSKVTIDLNLENNNYQTRLLSTTMMRNFTGP